MNKNPEKSNTYVEEVIKVIRPTTSNHIFNEERYEKVETYDKEGMKLVILREKSNQ